MSHAKQLIKRINNLLESSPTAKTRKISERKRNEYSIREIESPFIVPLDDDPKNPVVYSKFHSKIKIRVYYNDKPLAILLNGRIIYADNKEAKEVQLLKEADREVEKLINQPTS